ncbi:hypothetical protein [Dongia sp.]|uniref:hypothetical protein n=1 Tax=Dongia sp. TaxID=1977262 RepID=UPI003751D26C
MRVVFLLLAGLAIGGCTQTQDRATIPPLQSSGANCTGHFQFDTEHSGTGNSECRVGRGVAFSAKTEDQLTPGLACNYALFYASANNGTGELACSDGSTGVFKFQEDSNHRNGAFAVKLKDGRVFRFTYYTSG